jgi:uncharacterized OB-fold protein
MHTDTRTLTLEAATVIRVAPPGRSQPYGLAVVRTDQGLVCGQLLGSDEDLPAPGTPLTEAEALDGVRTFMAG